MAARKKRRKKAGLLWRVLFGHNGPTRGELKKTLGLTFSKTFDLNVRDPATGVVRKQRIRIGPDGKVQEVKAPAKKKGSTAKRPAAKKTTARQTASTASKPSRTSKTGATPRKRQSAAVPVPRRTRPETMSERFVQNPDGTFAGSRKQKPVTYAQAQREVAKAMKNAAAASKHAEELLGWQQRPAPRRRSS